MANFAVWWDFNISTESDEAVVRKSVLSRSCFECEIVSLVQPFLVETRTQSTLLNKVRTRGNSPSRVRRTRTQTHIHK